MTPMFQIAWLVLFGYHGMVSSQQGTTLHLQEIFKGRCLDYNTARDEPLGSMMNIDCDDFWLTFSSAWTNKVPCGNNNISYEQVIQLLNQTVSQNKILLWSGTKTTAHKFSKSSEHIVTLEDTLIGYVADNLKWCGRVSDKGIDYETCPAYGSCDGEPVKTFWMETSKWFASQAVGQVLVMLNGSNPKRQAYSKTSLFGMVEVPSLRKNLVTKLTAIIVHNFGKPKIENCNSKSVLELKSEVSSKYIDFECLENPTEVKMLLCMESPYSPECMEVFCGNDAVLNVGYLDPAGGTWAQMMTVITVCVLIMIHGLCI